MHCLSSTDLQNHSLGPADLGERLEGSNIAKDTISVEKHPYVKFQTNWFKSLTAISEHTYKQTLEFD